MAVDKGETKTCFIIMPISTPEGMLAQYRNDTDHFQHVLDHLLIPAVEKAGLKPISPKSKGSEVIHGDIVKKIETSDLVLCDMSTLNANVFFELGIRTSLNKPVCLVKDNLTDKVPFDTSIINYHTYLNALNAWELMGEIGKLSTHIQDTITKSSAKNALWKYFGLSAVAEAPVPKGGEEDRLQYLTLMIEGIKKELAKKTEETTPTLLAAIRRNDVIKLRNAFRNILSGVGISFDIGYKPDDNLIILSPEEPIDKPFLLKMYELAGQNGFKLEIDNRLWRDTPERK